MFLLIFYSFSVHFQNIGSLNKLLKVITECASRNRFHGALNGFVIVIERRDDQAHGNNGSRIHGEADPRGHHPRGHPQAHHGVGRLVAGG